MSHEEKFKEQVSKVAIVDGYEYRYLLLGISRYLKSHYNSHVCIYVQSDGAKKELSPYIAKNYVDEIKVIPRWKQISLQTIPKSEVDAVFKEAVEMEDFLGTTYNKVCMTKRDLGLGFYLGAYHHPRSVVSEKANHVQTVNAFNYIFNYWKNEFITEKISLVINGVKEPDVVAHALGIPFRYLYCTRIDNYFYWTRSVLCDFPEVKKEYELLKEQYFSPFKLENQFFLDVTHKNRVFSTGPLKTFLFKFRRLVLINLHRIFRRHIFKGYYFWSTARSLWVRYRNFKKLSYPHVKSLNEIKDKKFVYFPLAAEPEMSLHWMSPECISQLSVIASIARDLPADTFLVIKETIYSLGSRSKEFYGHMKRLKNVILLDVRELGLNVISSAKAVVTISGTSGLEAAIMGMPVVLLGRHNYYDFLDHIFLVTKEEELAPALQKALNKNFNEEKAKIDGARMRQAAINASFDLKGFTNIHRKNFDEEVIKNTVDGLFRSLTSDMKLSDQDEMVTTQIAN